MRIQWKLLLERHQPFGWAIIGFAVSILLKEYFVISDSLFSASISFGSIFTGFVATCLSILISSKTQAIRKLRNTKNEKLFKFFSDYTRSAMLGGFFFSFSSILALLIFDTNCLFLTNLLFPLWFANLIYCLFSGLRFGKIMFEIFKKES